MNLTSLSTLPECQSLSPVLGAGAYLNCYIEAHDTNYTQFANLVKTNTSTIKRLCDGAILTTELAAKLCRYASLCPEDLFSLEAARKTAKTRELLSDASTKIRVTFPDVQVAPLDNTHCAGSATLDQVRSRSQAIYESLHVPAHILNEGKHS